MKKILITGARSGIINKVADRLIKDNYLYLTVHTNSELKYMKYKYRNCKNLKCFKLDVTNEKDKEKIKKLDIDVFISNAAIGESGSVTEIDINKIKECFETNVFSNIELIQIVLKNMIEKGKGKIIIMSSLAGTIPMPFLGAYSASKASLTKLSECLNLELKILNKDIKISIIEPGLYKTGFNKLMIDKKYDSMDIETYFNNQIELIRKSENILLKLLEKRNLDSIVNKIIEAVNNDNPKLYYRAPFIQKIGTKIYKIIY